MNAPTVIVVDNRDSFTFNLVYDLEQAGCSVTVYRNDTPLTVLLERALAARAVFVLSPGPGAPRGAGVCMELVCAAAGRLGVLGICLGHQVIIEAFGGTVGPAHEIVHGRATVIECARHPLFAGLPPRIAVGRYHSLAAHVVPRVLSTVAVAADATPMAVVHRSARIAGLQFHPESILTPHGRVLLANALAWAGADATEGGDAAIA